MVGWNEDEYTFFASTSGDVSGCQLQDFDALHKKMEPQFGENTRKIIETYRIFKTECISFSHFH